MRQPAPRTDYWLWLALSGGLFLALVAAVVSASGLAMFRRLGEAAPILAGLALACAVGGWFGQEIARSCGLRLSGRPKPDEAADYDDNPPAG